MKYTLIVSQYYHSRYSFIVKFPENFYETMKKFIEELEDYKRSETRKKLKYNYGDIGYREGEEKIFCRYNVNDSGDIYIINSDYANYLMGIASEYKLDSYRESHRGYIRKEIYNNISEHHNYDKIIEIVEKYFEIV